MKAELFSTDFIISIILFISIIIVTGFYYNNLQSDIYQNYIRSDMQRKAISISDLLATSSGNPKYWDATNVNVLGLQDSGKINLTKFQELKKLDHNTVRNMLGTGVYNINITLKNETGSVINEGGTVYTFGTPIINAKNVVTIKRLGIADISTQIKKVIMEVILWE